MKNGKMIIKKVDVPLYFGELVIVKTDDWKKANKKFGIKMDETWDAVTFKEESKKGNLKYIIVLHSNLDPSVIAHEAVHLTNMIFVQTGCQLDPENDEAQAYLTGWIVRQIHEFIKELPANQKP